MSVIDESIYSSRNLEKKEKLIEEKISDKAEHEFKLRDIAKNPSYVGSWFHHMSKTSSLFTGLGFPQNPSLDSSIYWADNILVMDKLGFGIMKLNKRQNLYVKNYILSLQEVSEEDMLYLGTEGGIPSLSTSSFAIVNNRGGMIGRYNMRKFDSKSDRLLMPLIEEIYLQNLKKLKI